ncbi:MAG TPA: META domain-containing protein [Acidimicrobiia bacterium]|jgi:heat shock protein HslJ
MKRALLILGIALTACSSTTTTSTATPPTEDLWNETYSIVGLVVSGATRALVPDSNPSITFNGADMNGTTGCNSFFGTFSVDGDSISLSQLGQTEIGCEEPLTLQEQQIMAVLAAADRWSVEGGILTVGASDGTGALELGRGEGPPADAGLEGTRWVLDTLVDGDTASTPVAGAEATLTIEGGEAGGESGCNSFGGRVTVDPPTITFDEITTTEMACDQAVMDQEAFVYDVLGRATNFSIDGDLLTIDAGGRALVYRAA